MNLLDVDALSKLAHWDLLSELPPLTGFTNAQTATLSSLVHRAAKNRDKPDGKLFRDAAVAVRAHDYLKQLAPLPNPAEALLSVLQHVPAIDSGEAVLLATLYGHPDTMLITGDKRALTGLKGAVSSGILASLSDRIIIVEQIILALLRKKGVDWLREHICPFQSLDKAIGIVMGSECKASAESVEAGLKSYIDDVRSSTGTLLRSDASLWSLERRSTGR